MSDAIKKKVPAPALSRALAAPYGAAVAGVAGMTLLIWAMPGAQHVANISMLYLLVVIGVAVTSGSGPAVAASVLAFLTFDWFFIDPRYTFTVRDPSEWLALVMFLVTAGVTGQLTAMLRQRAEEARRRERETLALARASWAIAAQVDRDHALAEVLRRTAEVVPLESAAIFAPAADGSLRGIAGWPEGGATPEALPGEAAAAAFVLREGKPVAWGEDPRHWEKALPEGGARDTAYLPLTAEDRVLGVLHLRLPGIAGLPAQERRVVESLANHAAVALARDRLARAETQARALLEADHLKTALLSMVSHDFRSPLAGIKASVTGLLQGGQPWDPEAQRELLAGIDREADRLNGMVGNILALSRLEAGAWRPRREPVEVGELAGAALDSFAAEENRRISVHLQEGLGEFSLDETQIVQVLRNLIENALKYSPPGSPVELRARREGDSLVVEVLDRGPGLAAGEEGQIFAPFYRAERYRESALPGTGLGLAVSRGLARAHGGDLAAANRPGGGARFVLTLPLEG